MKLSNNFSLKEFTKSNTAIRKGIDNNPTDEHLTNMKALCNSILQPLRDYLGKPLKITSGYRSKALNEAIGGSKTSQHSLGQAADLELWIDGKEENKLLFDTIIKTKLPFDQLIYEFGDDNNPDWVHVSYSDRNRRQILRAIKVDGKTKYITFEV